MDSRAPASLWLSAWAFLLAIFAVSCSPTPDVVVFAQLSDPHLFDAGKWRLPKGAAQYYPANEEKRSAIELESAKDSFDWALARLKDRKDLDFVVITGDFGLEMVSPFWEKDSARVVAEKLASLPVDKILLVPGNNDLLNEDPRDIYRYWRFVRILTDELKGKKVVVDLTTQKAALMVKGIGILGLESSTFKNECKHSKTCEDEPQRMRYQSLEMNRLATAMTGTQGPTIVFTHIPDLFDPHPPDQNNPKSLKDSWFLWGDDPMDDPMNDARTTWDGSIANNQRLKGVFAGHFHSDNEKDYGVPLHLKRPGAAKPCVIVAPPLASKFGGRVQGFLIGNVNSQGGVTLKLQYRVPGVTAAREIAAACP